MPFRMDVANENVRLYNPYNSLNFHYHDIKSRVNLTDASNGDDEHKKNYAK